MSLEITFELSSSDLEHFREVMLRAREATRELSRETIIEQARALLEKVNRSHTPNFIRDRVNQLGMMIGMVVDEGWGLEEEDKTRVVSALSYFSEAEDLIPDDIPVLGFLDDAIMIEIVTRELEPEIHAYREFCVFRAAESSRLGADADTLARSDWLQERRQQLHSRMRRRRRRGGGGDLGEKSPFSLL